ncbi:MAG: carbamate kinase [Candidatus Cloacimonadaceae bacterium]
MKKTALIALGGNAIIKAGQKGTAYQQFENTARSLDGIVRLIHEGYNICLIHGNGPQVGNMLRQQELAEPHGIPPLPLGLLNAATQGTMGYMIEQSLQNRLKEQGLERDVISILTQIVVDENDESFRAPTKFIGSRYYSADEAEQLRKSMGWMLKEDSGKGYRRVVASPKPQKIIPAKSIAELIRSGTVVIAAGGGGIPVIQDEHGKLSTIDAVIDKDLAGALLAHEIGAESFIILTSVEKVCLNYGKANQEPLSQLSLKEAKDFYEQGQFPAGSMGPKILAAMDFIQHGGKEVIITSIENLIPAIEGKAGTRIYAWSC